jgi:LacI family transcriptional regulator
VAKKAPTIRELAQAAGVSLSTVSIVLSGKSEERRITPETQAKVLDAARALGYQTNVSARRLRSQTDASIVVAVFWASDFRAPLMVRFLRGLQSAVLSSGRRAEIVIHPYHNDALHESMVALGLCHAAIICNASPADMEFLESFNPPVPIVLYNRHSARFCTVNVDDQAMGAMAARVLAGRGHRQVVLLTSDSVFPGMDARADGFVTTAEAAGLSVLRIHEDNSAAGGYQGALAVAAMRPTPDGVFAISDAMAIGALRAFHQRGVRVPEDTELIAIGNGDKDQEEYAVVPLSVVHLPMEKMAVECFDLALGLVDGSVTQVRSVKLDTSYVQRDSCGGIGPGEGAFPAA